VHEIEFVFAYGSNMDPAQMRARCPESALVWFIAEARDKALWFPRKSEKRKGGVGSLKDEKGKSVWGVVFAVSLRDLVRLDRFEGVPGGSYERKEIEVFDSKGKRRIVWAHIAVPQKEAPFAPHRDYISLYISGAEYYGLPAEYLAGLKRIRHTASKS
jgi:gamma-glutamylcyclotransferase (GGCT)/AIG2-like uncharacterized protein YtfP